MQSVGRILILILVVICFFRISALEAEEQKTYEVSGHVVDSKTGKAIPDARVIFRKPNPFGPSATGPLFETLAGKDGGFKITLQAGQYHVAARHPDFSGIGTTQVLVGNYSRGKDCILRLFNRKAINVNLPAEPDFSVSRNIFGEAQPSPQPDTESTKPVRVAIFKSFKSSQSAAANRLSDSFVDLLTVALSREQRFAVVERQAINKILNEMTVNLANEQPDETAMKAGRLANARLAVTATIVEKDNAAVVVVRVMDISKGFVRDAFTIAINKDRLEENVRQAARMISRLRDDSQQVKNRPVVAIGSFVDESLNSRFIRLDEELRAHLQQYYMPQTPVVERVLIAPLLMELEMGMGGLTDEAVDQSRLQPAVILIDGVYKAFHQKKDKISLTLRAHQIGGMLYYTTLDLPADKRMKKWVDYASDRLLEQIINSPSVVNSRQKEALAHIARGKEILGMKGGSDRLNNDYFNDASRKREEFDQAVAAFESALTLMPESDETRFDLALCYANPIINDYERGLKYIEDIVTAPTDGEIRLRVVKFVLKNYTDKGPRNDKSALKILRNILPQITTEDKQSRRWAWPMYQMAEKGLISEADYRQYIIDYYRERMDRLPGKCESGSISQVTNYIDDFLCSRRGFFNSTGDPEPDKFGPMEHRVREEYYQQMMGIVKKKYPRFLPYFFVKYLHVHRYSKGKKTDPLHEELRAIIQSVSESTDNVNNYKVFCRIYLGTCFSWAREHGYYDTAARIGELQLKCSKPNIGNIADCYCHLGEYQSALRVLEQAENLEGKAGGCFKELGAESLIDAKKICEVKLGTNQDAGDTVEPLPPVTASFDTFTLPPPLMTFDEIAGFDVYENECWVSVGTRIAQYRPKEKKLRTRALLTDTRQAIRFLVAGRDNIYISNKLKGLYIFNKQTGDIKVVMQEDGLPLARISALHYTPERVWMGFSSGKTIGGDVGYWDTAAQKYTGLAGQRQVRSGAFRSSRDQPSDPPNRPVVGISQSPPDNLWAVVLGKGLQKYDMATGEWSTWTSSETRINIKQLDKNTGMLVLRRGTIWKDILDFDNKISCVAANDKYVALGCISSPNGNRKGLVSGGVSIYSYNHPPPDEEPLSARSFVSKDALKDSSAALSLFDETKGGMAFAQARPKFSGRSSAKKSGGLSFGKTAPSKRKTSSLSMCDSTDDIDHTFHPDADGWWVDGGVSPVKYWSRLGELNGLPDASVLCVEFSPANELWVGGKDYIAIVDLDTKKVTRVCNLEDRIIRKIQIVNDEVWILAFKSHDLVRRNGYNTNGSEIYRIPL